MQLNQRRLNRLATQAYKVPLSIIWLAVSSVCPVDQLQAAPAEQPDQ